MLELGDRYMYDIGMIGLAVMGENLVLNMESKGFSVCGFDIDQKVDLSDTNIRN